MCGWIRVIKACSLPHHHAIPGCDARIALRRKGSVPCARYCDHAVCGSSQLAAGATIAYTSSVTVSVEDPETPYQELLENIETVEGYAEVFEEAFGEAGYDGVKQEITEIVDLLLAGLNKRLVDRKVSVSFTPAAKKWIGEKGYDPTYGARPLKRFLQKQVETQLARALVAGEVDEGAEVTFSSKDDELVMKVS